MRRPLAILASLAVLGLAGCGAEAEEAPELTGPEEDVAQVLEDLQTAADEDAPRRVCTDLLARELSRQLGNRCTEAMAQAFEDADTSQIEVRDVRVSGSTARARISTGSDDENQEMIELVREGGVWRIREFGGPVRN